MGVGYGEPSVLSSQIICISTTIFKSLLKNEDWPFLAISREGSLFVKIIGNFIFLMSSALKY